MLSRKSEALKLKAIKEVEWDEHRHSLSLEAVSVSWVNLESVNSIGRHCHDAKVEKETLESFVVRLTHQLDQHAIVQNAITLLPLAVFDVSPIFVVRVDVGKTVGVSLAVQHLSERVFDIRGTDEGVLDIDIGKVFILNEEGYRSSVRRHGELAPGVVCGARCYQVTL